MDTKIESPAQSAPYNEIYLKQIVSVIWSRRIFVVVATALVTAATIAYVLTIPDRYRAAAILAPAQSNMAGGLSGQLSQVAPLADLAGVTLSSGGVNRTAYAIQLLQSRKFVADFVARHGLVPQLMAVTAWDRANDRLQFDDQLYDVEGDEWVRRVKSPYAPMPSGLETFEEFMRHFSVQENAKTGFVQVSFSHISATSAKQIVDKIIVDLNEDMRTNDVAEANRAIDFLKSKMADNRVAQLDQAFSRLLETQLQTAMLANISPDYVFKIVDPAVVEEVKATPRRKMITILAFAGGLLGSSLIVVIGHFSMLWPSKSADTVL